ncbi:MAG: hypothetical protein ABH852_01685 [Methanobacteriota archaeon]
MAEVVIILPDAEDVARKTYELLIGEKPKHRWSEFRYKSARLVIRRRGR